nr:ASCH domain-containing protein [Halomonas sp.]
MLALSIVSPHGSNIASGKKTLEVRSWRPESLPIRDLLIVENSHFLSADNLVIWLGVCQMFVLLPTTRFLTTWLCQPRESYMKLSWCNFKLSNCQHGNGSYSAMIEMWFG